MEAAPCAPLGDPISALAVGAEGSQGEEGSPVLSRIRETARPTESASSDILSWKVGPPDIQGPGRVLVLA